MNKPVLSVDFDDAIVDFNGCADRGLIGWHNRVYGLTEKRDDITDFDHYLRWGITKEQALIRMWDFVQSNDHKMIRLLPGIEYALPLLAQHFTLHIVTARDSVKTREATEYLLNNRTIGGKTLASFFEGVHYMHQDRRVVFATKGEICAQIGATAHIDDHEGHLHSLPPNVKGFLFDQPWNKVRSQGPKAFMSGGWGDVPLMLLR